MKIVFNNNYLLHNKEIIVVFNNIIMNNIFNIEELEFGYINIKIVIKAKTNMIKKYIN